MITVYSKDNCIQCRMTKKQLNDLGKEFVEININHDLTEKERDEWIDNMREQGIASMPVVMKGNKTISGYRPSDLIKL